MLEEAAHTGSFFISVLSLSFIITGSFFRVTIENLKIIFL